MTAACSRTFAPFAPESESVAVWNKGWIVAVLCWLTLVFNYTYYTSGSWTGLPQSATDARGVTLTTSAYDALLRPTAITASGTSGQLAGSQSTACVFDWLGRLTSVE